MKTLIPFIPKVVDVTLTLPSPFRVNPSRERREKKEEKLTPFLNAHEVIL
jgi:hypothetical protein